MPKKEIRIGLIGFGAMGKTHAYAVQNLPFFFTDLDFRARIVGVATTNAARAKKIAEDYGFSRFTDDPMALIGAKDIDVIDICTPNSSHAQLAAKALAAGKHIYCEKPLCDNYADAKRIAELAAASGKVCTVVFNNRYLCAVARARQLIEQGRIGRILQFRFEYLHDSCTDPQKPAGWKQDRALCGAGGVLFDLGSHVLDLAVWLCGRFSTIASHAQIAFPTRIGSDGAAWQTNAPECFDMTVTTKDGAVGTLCASKLATGTNDDLNFAIYGERGAIRFSLMEPNFLQFYDATRPAGALGAERGFTRIECVGRYAPPAGAFPSPKASVGWLRGHVMSMYDFLHAVSVGKQNSPSFSDAAYVQYLMELALRCAADGTQRQVDL